MLAAVQMACVETPTGTLVVRNRQRAKRLPAGWLRRIILAAMAELGVQGPHELCFHLVSAREMAALNWQYLRHEGPTDVITFDGSEGPGSLAGEIFICVAVAVAQAKEFGTTWRHEVARYAAHGLLHLLGYDDQMPAARRRMKAVENRVMRRLALKEPTVA